MVIFVRLILMLSLFYNQSCFSNKKTSQPENKNSAINSVTREQDSLSENYRFIVSFISIGSGTDAKAHSLFVKYLSDYKYTNKDTLSYDVIPWGREGEVDYCIRLSELMPNEQTKFITDIKRILKDSTLARYKENAPCLRRDRHH